MSICQKVIKPFKAFFRLIQYLLYWVWCQIWANHGLSPTNGCDFCCSPM